MPGPITPDEVDKTTVVPEAVFEIVNTLITETWDGESAIVYQNGLVDRIRQALGCERQTIFDKHYLDFEEAYRKVGWRVEYEKPAFNETGPTFFRFTKK